MKPSAAIITCLLFCFSLANSSANSMDTINFKVQSEGYNLDVQVLKKSSESRVPAIIFLVGSGGESSHNTNYKDFTAFFLEEKFLENGFAIVYFDKRGVGQSEGIWYETTFEQRALDATNVGLAIRDLDFINKDKIYLVGHSQGGWIAQIALSNHPEIFAAAVSMAGPTFGVRKQLVNDYMSKYICKKRNSEAKALNKATKKVKRDLYFVNKFGKKGNWKQLKLIQDFEPRRYIFNIEKPLFLMLAENDELVNPQWCLDEIPLIFPSGKPSHIQIYIAPSETHSFKKAHKCYDRDWKNVPYSAESQKVLYNWIMEKSK